MKRFKSKVKAIPRSPWSNDGWEKLTRILVKRRYLFFFGTIVFVFLIELIDHLLIDRLISGNGMYFDAIFFIITIPIGTWLLLKLLEKTEKARLHAEHNFTERNDFSQSLGEADDWDDLISRVARFPGSVVAQSTTILYVLNPISNRMEAEAACGPHGEIELRPRISISPDSLPIGSLSQLLTQNNQGLFYDPANPDPRLPPHRFDLSITRGDQQIAVIKLQFPETHAPSAEELRVLKSAAPVIALAIEGVQLQNLATRQAADSEKNRQQIAQNLHDTLAQNVGYLRLKLDQLTGENAIREIGVVLQELERMRDTAEEAYQQVRNTLDQLSPVQHEDLQMLVNKQAEIISRRAGFCLNSNQIGNPFLLPAVSRQQILYIAREALHNIEKHAHANQVHLQFIWLSSELIIRIVDDGIGFDPRRVSNDGHYGLWIMQHRAQEMGGTLKISPVESGKGMQVTLWVPNHTLIMKQSSIGSIE